MADAKRPDTGDDPEYLETVRWSRYAAARATLTGIPIRRSP
jgi:hypothetical protein